MTRGRRIAVRCGAVLAAAAVALVGPVPAAASESFIELQVEPTGYPPWANPNASVQVAVHASSSEHEGPVELEVTYDLGDLYSSLDVNTSNCQPASGTRYRCTGQVVPGDPTTIGLPVTAKPDRARASGDVNVSVVALGVDSNRATTSVTLEVLSNRVDLSVTSTSERSYTMVGPGTDRVGAYVRYPHMIWSLPVRVTFDFAEASSGIEVVGTDPSHGETCTRLTSTRYRCEQVWNGRGGSAFFGGVLVAPRSGAPPGPVGRVQIDVELVDGTDPNPGNNSFRMMLDVATGSTTVRVDVGEATGRIGDTVTLPVTMRNLGPDTVEWMGIARTPLTGGLELAGLEGCVSGVPETGSLCTGPQWMRGGTSHTVGMRVKIHRCHDDHAIMPNIHTSSGTIERGSFGTVNVEGCGGASGGVTGTGASSPTGDSDVAVDPDAEPTGAPAGPAGVTPAAAPADTAPSTVHAGDWVTVGQPHLGTGLGMTGVILLLGLVALARSARWALVRHAGVR